MDDVADVPSTLVDEIRLQAVDARDEASLAARAARARVRFLVCDLMRHRSSLSHLPCAATIPGVDLGGGAA
jgi:hypothetical protein